MTTSRSNCSISAALPDFICLPLADLARIVESMAAAAKAAGVPIVTGDTKVVERGTKSIDTMLYFLLFNIAPTVLELLLVLNIFRSSFGWGLVAATMARKRSGLISATPRPLRR